MDGSLDRRLARIRRWDTDLQRRGTRLTATKADGANGRAKLTFQPDRSVGVGLWFAIEMMNRVL